VLGAARTTEVALAPTSEVGLDASTAVLDGRIEAYGFPVQLNQPLLSFAAVDQVWVLLEGPRDVDVAACVLAEPEIWGGIMSPVGPTGQAGCAPVEVVVGWMALTASREIVQTSPAAVLGSPAFADVQQSGRVRRPEAIQAGCLWDQPVIACPVEVMPG
jgi:hypothetical protein